MDSEGGNIKVREYKWGDVPPEDFMIPFDVIVGSDLIYNVLILDELLHSFQLLGHPKTVIYLAHKTRFKSIEDNFFEKAAKQFRVELVHTVHPEYYKKEEEVRVYKLTSIPT